MGYDRVILMGMGHLEESSRKRQRRNTLKKIVLGTIAISGGVAVAVMAPNALGAMAKMGLLPNKRQKDSINQARDRLIKQGLIRIEHGFLRITPKGTAALHLLEAKDTNVPGYDKRKPKRWDGRWRMLIFDIPETRRSTRDKIRRSLISVGFQRLQDSVWAYPYDCEDFVSLLKADFKIGKDMLYLIVEEMEGDRHLRDSFGLRARE